MKEQNKTPGRPRKYQTEAEKVKAYHDRKISEGYNDIRIMLSDECVGLLDRLCAETNMTKADAISYLLINYYEEDGLG